MLNYQTMVKDLIKIPHYISLLNTYIRNEELEAIIKFSL